MNFQTNDGQKVSLLLIKVRRHWRSQQT